MRKRRKRAKSLQILERMIRTRLEQERTEQRAELEACRLFMEKNVLRPMVDKLIESGAIPKTKEPYRIEWDDLP